MPPNDDHSSPFDDILAHEDQLESTPSGSYPRVLRFGVILAAVSFVIALLGSVIGNNVTGDPVLEGWATAANRYGMLFLLLACFAIFAAIRGPSVVAKTRSWRGVGSQRSDWSRLLGWSFLAMCIVAPSVAALVVVLGHYASVVFFLFTPTLLSLGITLAVWSAGATRAYAICFTTTLLSFWLCLVSWSLGWANIMFMNTRFYSNQNDPFDNFRFVSLVAGGILAILAISIFNGLVGAGLVIRFEKSRTHNQKTAT